ncbi:MAG: 50S ribosomal protein L3 [Phycisphaerae bacterium]|nr:50S ribosomal protein L3 [Phycisphaerae bacterium]
MIPALLGKKIGMAQVFDTNGRAVPVTLVKAGPCTVMQVRTTEHDGYEAVQLGFGDVKPHRSTLPLIGHALKANTTPKRWLQEIRLQKPAEHQPGDVLTVELFGSEVRYVDVTGISKGKGFAGAMKRHGFGGQPASHGTERKHRSPGSIASHCSERGRGGKPVKGKRMAGHMGHVRVTVKSQQLMGTDLENNLLIIRGSIPGPNGSVVMVRKAKTRS